MAARAEIEKTVATRGVVLYTYGWSPFSTEAKAILDSVGVSYHTVELGAEWFTLGQRGSVLRAELLEMTGQSSLPHVFIGGEHVGGLFSGTPGLAALNEAGELKARLLEAEANVRENPRSDSDRPASQTPAWDPAESC